MGSLASLWEPGVKLPFRLPVPAFQNIPSLALHLSETLRKTTLQTSQPLSLPCLLLSTMLALLVFTETSPPGSPPGLFLPELAPFLMVMTEPKVLYK